MHWAAITQALFLSIYFLRGRPGFRLQSLLLALIAFGVFQGYLYSSHRILSVPHLARIGFTTMGLMGPLILLATYSILKVRLSSVMILPFLVPAGISLYLIPFYASSADSKLAYLREDLVQIHFDCVVILYAALINNLICLVFVIRRLSSGRKPENRFFFFGILLLVLLVPFVLSIVDQNLLNSGLFSGVVSVLVLLRSWQMVYRAESGRIASFLFELFPQRYQKSRVAVEKMADIASRIEKEFENKPYLDPDYSLPDLARALNEPAHSISQVFSQHKLQNFAAFISEKRLEEAKAMLVSPAFAEFSVLRIGFEAGFNSKSSFYEVFRRQTGQTPAEYRAKKTALHA